MCNFNYIKICKNWAKIGQITVLHWNRFKIKMTPKSNTSQIDGASVIETLHIPSFCCKSHYTHARYIYSTENLNFCVERGVLTPFQWECQSKKGVVLCLGVQKKGCWRKAFFWKFQSDDRVCATEMAMLGVISWYVINFLKHFSFKLLGVIWTFQSERR